MPLSCVRQKSEMKQLASHTIPYNGVFIHSYIIKAFVVPYRPILRAGSSGSSAEPHMEVLLQRMMVTNVAMVGRQSSQYVDAQPGDPKSR